MQHPGTIPLSSRYLGIVPSRYVATYLASPNGSLTKLDGLMPHAAAFSLLQVPATRRTNYHTVYISNPKSRDTRPSAGGALDGVLTSLSLRHDE